MAVNSVSACLNLKKICAREKNKNRGIDGMPAVLVKLFL